MPRTKGSKNKPKTVTADFASKIAVFIVQLKYQKLQRTIPKVA